MATIEELREQVRSTDFTPEQQIRIAEITPAVEHDADYAASEIVKLEAERDAALRKLGRCRSALRELHATVQGECPALLDEDRDGNARLAMAIEEALSDE